MPSLAKLVNAGVSGRIESILPLARPGRTDQGVTADDESAKVKECRQVLDYVE